MRAFARPGAGVPRAPVCRASGRRGLRRLHVCPTRVPVPADERSQRTRPAAGAVFAQTNVAGRFGRRRCFRSRPGAPCRSGRSLLSASPLASPRSAASPCPAGGAVMLRVGAVRPHASRASRVRELCLLTDGPEALFGAKIANPPESAEHVGLAAHGAPPCLSGSHVPSPSSPHPRCSQERAGVPGHGGTFE